jgi:RNase P subunit RPR2
MAEQEPPEPGGLRDQARRLREARQVEAEIKRILADQRGSRADAKAAFIELAILWLQRKWGEQACPYCHEADWQVGTPLEVRILPAEVMSPAFPVMCGNCGHTTFVNARLSGVLPEGVELSQFEEES